MSGSDWLVDLAKLNLNNLGDKIALREEQKDYYALKISAHVGYLAMNKSPDGPLQWNRRICSSIIQ